MTEDEAYKVHIQYTFNAFCKIVIRHAAIDKILKLRRKWEREISLDYLMNEKFVQLAEPEQLEEYLFTACGQTAVLYHAELAAALALLPEQTQEEIFRYYFLRQPQRVIGVHIGRTRSTAGRHIGRRGNLRVCAEYQLFAVMPLFPRSGFTRRQAALRTDHPQRGNRFEALRGMRQHVCGGQQSGEILSRLCGKDTPQAESGK